MTALDVRLRRALFAIVGEDGLLEDAPSRETYGRDWTRFHVVDAAAVVRPRDTSEVSAVLQACSAADHAVVPSGGRTGLSAGAVATQGEIVLSLERLDDLGVVDGLGGTVRVGAGAITARVHAHVEEAGFIWPIDLAAKGSSQIGGNLSTNAGGVRVIRYGAARHWVLGLRVCLMDGRVLDLGGALEKDNTGYDLVQLFVGSEGTLGVITEATLKLTRPPRTSSTTTFSLRRFEDALALFELVSKSGLQILAFETYTRRCLDEVVSAGLAKRPFDGGEVFALVEVACRDDDLLPVLEAALELPGVEDGVLAQSTAQARALWACRENITAALSHRGVVNKNDISVPVARLAPFVERLRAAVTSGGALGDLEVFLFGHIGDGNLHVNVPKPAAMSGTDFGARRADIDEVLVDILEDLGGSISAEHGVGLLKRKQLERTRGPQVEIFRQLKNVFDPRGLLNPGKIFA